MGCVGREPPLSLEHALDAQEHLVERLDQPRHFIVPARMGQPLGERRRPDDSRATDDPIDRKEDGSGQHRSGQRHGAKDCCRHHEEQSAHRSDRVAGVVERPGDLDRIGFAADLQWHREHANGLVAELLERLEYPRPAAKTVDKGRGRRKLGGPEVGAPGHRLAVIEAHDLDKLVEAWKGGRGGPE